MAQMVSMTLFPQVRLEQGQRGAPAAAAQDGAFKGLLLQALLGGRGRAGPGAGGAGGDGQADPAPGGGQGRTPGATVPVLPPELGPAEPGANAQSGEPAAADHASETAVAILKRLLAEHGFTNMPAPIRTPSDPATTQPGPLVPDPAQVPAPGESGEAAHHPAAAGCASATAVAVLKRLLAEHGFTNLPAPIRVSGQPAPEQPAAPDQPLPVGADALLASLAQALLAALLPGPAPAQPQGTDSSGAQALAPAALPEQADAALEGFARQVLTALTNGEAESAEGKPTGGQPTFQDLIRLIAGEEPAKAPHQAPEAPHPVPSALAKPVDASERLPLKPADSDKAGHDADQVPQLQVAGARSEQAEQPADPAPAQAGTPVEPEQVVRQAARFVKVALEGQRSEVRFQLHPEHLGAIAVRLVLNEGTVRANMTAADPAVKAVLEANLEQLRSRLADQGYQVEQIHVTVGGGSPFGQPQHSHQDGQHQPRQPGQRPWQARQGQQEGPEDQAPPSPQRPARTWLPGRKGSRIDSLA